MAQGSGPPWAKLALLIAINAVMMLAAAAAVFVLRPFGSEVDTILPEVLLLAGGLEMAVALWFFRKASDQ